MKTYKLICAIVTMGALALTTGCVGTHPDQNLGGKLVSVQPQAVAVRVTVPDAPAPLQTVHDRNDINQVIAFALAKSDAGRHAEAASVFLDAANRFRSEGQALEQDLVKAAIAQHWLAGDIDAVRSDFELLANFQKDIYDTYNEDATIRTIRRIVAEE